MLTYVLFAVVFFAIFSFLKKTKNLVFNWSGGESLKIDHVYITLDDLPHHLDGTIAVQLSDFHEEVPDQEPHISDALLFSAIEESNKLNPDLVFLTGDFVQLEPDSIDSLSKKFAQLRAKKGIYAVLGNHDLHASLNGYESIATAIRTIAPSVQILRAGSPAQYPLGPGLAIIGTEDLWHPNFDPIAPIENVASNCPRILLTHNPDVADLMRTYRVDLQLSGHTHGGQVSFPLLGPIAPWFNYVRRLLPSRYVFRIPLIRNVRIMMNWDWCEGLHPVRRVTPDGSDPRETLTAFKKASQAWRRCIAPPKEKGWPKLPYSESRELHKTIKFSNHSGGGHHESVNWIYVNRGLATHRPFRLFTPPELTVFHFNSKK